MLFYSVHLSMMKLWLVAKIGNLDKSNSQSYTQAGMSMRVVSIYIRQTQVRAKA